MGSFTATYWRNLFKDYKEAALDAAKDCKEHPLKASTYISILAAGVYLNRCNPTESSFKEELLQNTIKIMQVGQNVRNPITENYVKWLGQCYNEGIVRRLNLGIISFIWLDDYDEMCALYKAICPYLKVRYLTFHKRVIDIGFMDKWWVLDNKMKDYDVNEAEFHGRVMQLSN
ncbi:mitochondrial import inner membrane translocase subunit Tim29 isoform X2 [Ceratina calcarata]|uniref:Mitochondrial import inner membrane translocase subunit Tim29 isoform X2 n=1 Tax=Ceratina calcarata TaxID=156304 RepID=A0AAJ7WDI2_9HYME|nr:mitochondrial import inner membrane translocase subunit Tim29 isoform X2 [Ceratina calcarata]